MDWMQVLRPDVPVLETVARGSALYLALLVILRVVKKREEGAVGLQDLLLIVLLADAASNGLSGGYESLGSGLVLVGTIVAWSHGLSWLAYRSPLVRRVLHPPPLPLVENGRILHANLKKELLTEEELCGKLREAGFADLARVRRAYMETDGRISVLS